MNYQISGGGTVTGSQTTSNTTQTWYFAGVDITAGAASTFQFPDHKKKRRYPKPIRRSDKRNVSLWMAALQSLALFSFIRRKHRLIKRFARQAKHRGLCGPSAALIALFPFLRKRRKLYRDKRNLRHHERWFCGDITPIAPSSQCFTITVSAELAATLAVWERLAARTLEVERLAVSSTALERLSATGLVQARLGCTVTIVCCH
jgi:hypothetical protein